MGLYIKKFSRIGFALGPSEERGFVMWVGYDVLGVSGDLSAYDLVSVDGWTAGRLAEYNVVTFKQVTPRQLGIEDE
ncbi:MAG: hypothetical protein JWN02_659 [Acidobacteria bacterium]|nr:hypothetical protein [Acidobacteriota bacterium]